MVIAGHPKEVVDQTKVAAAKTLRVSEPISGTSNVPVTQMSVYLIRVPSRLFSFLFSLTNGLCLRYKTYVLYTEQI